ncbi:hypothetical protein SteCoe_7491 [Stentor coeruleus]|uniref:B box-type domain-containing protein n=1 Tax=Stentor coeruleus TaxID=5963 RepID=A0A1R2CMF4_9CILI|nr:hypothetical protein SteCoe_7491 [Stentor coeruleus]
MKKYCNHCQGSENKDKWLFLCCETKMCSCCMEEHILHNPNHNIIIRNSYRLSSNTEKLLSELKALKKRINDSILRYERKVQKVISQLSKVFLEKQSLLLSYIEYIENCEVEIATLPRELNTSKKHLLNLIINFDVVSLEELHNTYFSNINLKWFKKGIDSSFQCFFELPYFLDNLKSKPKEFIDSGIKSIKKYEIKEQEIQEFRKLMKKAKKCDFLANTTKKLEDYRSFKHTYRITITAEECQELAMAQCLIKLSNIMVDVNSLYINYLNDNQISWLFPGITNFPKLKHLNLYQCAIDNQWPFKNISLGLKNANNLKLFSIEYSNLLCTGLIIILPNLSRNLKALSVIGNLIGASGAEVLAKVLPEMNELKRLYLSDNDIGLVGIMHILKGLYNCGQLRTLDISKNNIPIDGIAATLDTLANFPYIACINISSNIIDDESPLLHVYARCLPRMKYLRNFIVNMNSSKQIRKEIFKFVPKFCTLFISNEGQKSQVNRFK